jgi:N-acetylglucosaminyldiphosphoundecaprenol N-acetyl-beta-D-mannosaminyltransferase
MKGTFITIFFLTNQLSISSIFNHKGRIYTFLNPVSYLEAIKWKSLYNSFDGIFIDGSILSIAIKCLYGKTIIRRSFDMTSLAPILFNFAEQNKKKIYIIASQEIEIKKAISIFKEKWPNLNIIGYRNGYFSSEEEIDIEINRIRIANPDFLIVGMGVIKQEQFLLKVKKAQINCIGFTCGGFIHQTAHNKINYYPKWVDSMNLRFLYRMYKEKHTRKRYIQAALIFPLRFIYERFFG